MTSKTQNKTPFFTKLVAYTQSDMVQHDVPGHKMGHIPSDLLDFAGSNMFKLDVNAPRGLDNLNKPKTVIKEASKLMADAFSAEKGIFF